MTNNYRVPAASGRVIAAALLSYACMAAPATAQTTISLTQYSYDAAERMQCTTVRMNPAAFGSPPADVCTPSAQQTIDPDRVTRYSRDATGRPLQVQLAYGTSAQATDKTFTYTADGMVASMADANNNLTTMTYDGYDRLSAMNFPDPSNAGSSSASDYEAYGYDGDGNRTSLRKRDGRTLGYSYDALNRVTVKSVPTSCASGYTCTNPPGWATRSVYYAYDLMGHQTEARFDSAQGGDGVFSGYDGLGRLTSTTTAMAGTSRQLTFGYDGDDNRTQVTFPDGQQFGYSYDGLDRETLISQPGGGGLVSTSYDAVGQLNAHSRANSAQSSFSYDAAGRMTGISHDLNGSVYDQSYGLGYNPASQVNSLTESNDGYAWRGAANANIGYSVNGLNQYTNVGGAGYGYDSNGNLTSDGSTAYVYDVENRLVSASSGTTLTYDANGRMWQVAGGASGTSQFLYDGDQLAVEYDGSGNLQRRYLHGGGEDNPLIWYEGSGLGSPRYYHADHQGSVVAVSDANGNPVTINSYDEYGMPARGNLGRFGNTGQAWLPDLGLWHYKARAYSPKLGRFLQTDPIGYKDQSNLYAYVANDPVNKTDPTGEDGWDVVHGALAVGSFCPSVCGSAVAGVDAIIYASQGDKTNAAIAGGAALAGIVSDAGAVRVGATLLKDGVVAARGLRAESSIARVALRAQLGAQEIARGHAWAKHGAEFGDLGIKTEKQFERHIEGVLANPSEFKTFKDGRTLSTDTRSGTVVWRNPGAEGTAFRPKNFDEYLKQNGLGK